MAFNFPDGASNGDTHTASNGVVYRFDGTVWVVDRPSNTTSFDSKYLNTTGDGIVSSSAQITDGSGIISGSTHLFTAVTSSGDISGSGTGSFGVINVGGGIFTSASLAAGGSGVSSYTDLTNVPSGIISGSSQLPSGIISGSSQITSVLPSGVISGSGQLPSGIISGSGQLPSGIVSGSSQITSILPSGTISGSVQITQNSGILSGSITSQLPDGVISGSLQLPSGLISGSTQISESGFVSSSTTNIIEVMTSASYASITPVTGTLYIIQG